MGGIFSLDSPLMQGLNKIIDCIFLSLLWILFSLPLITIGASTSALYYTANKAVRNGRGYIWQQFWGGFKSSFKQGTILWIIIVFIELLLYNDARIMGILYEAGKMSYNVAYAARIFFYVLMLVIGLIAMYLFPYVARFSAPLKNVLKNCIYMTLRHLLMTICALLVILATAFLMWLIPITALILPTLGALVCTFIFEHVFVRYMSEEDRLREQKLNGKEYL